MWLVKISLPEEACIKFPWIDQSDGSWLIQLTLGLRRMEVPL